MILVQKQTCISLEQSREPRNKATHLWTVTAAMNFKRCLLLGRKAMTDLDSILKSRDITLPTKVLIVKAMVFPVVMYRYESWTIKKG